MSRGRPIPAILRVLLVTVALGTVTVARPAAPPPPPVDEIVERYVAARGGLEKIRSIQTLRQRGHATAGANRRALVTRELKRPAQTRFEFRVQGVTAVYVTDGRQGWKVSPFDGAMDPTPLSDEVVSEAAEQAEIEGPLVDWKAKGHRLELVGRQVVGGREAYKLELSLEGGQVRHEYIDVKTFYLLRTDSTRQVRGRTVGIETTYSDFRKKGGVLFPHLIEVAAAGRPQRLRVVVDEIEVNPPLSDARFGMPVPVEP